MSWFGPLLEAAQLLAGAPPTGPANLKTYLGVAKVSIKTAGGVALANIKKLSGVA